jgi:hypothetical protein
MKVFIVRGLWLEDRVSVIAAKDGVEALGLIPDGMKYNHLLESVELVGVHCEGAPRLLGEA